MKTRTKGLFLACICLNCFAISPSSSLFAAENISVDSVESIQQNNTVIGMVVDESGYPLIGVTIKIKGQDRGTVTDFEGQFSLKVNNGETLEVSYIGFIPQTIKYNKAFKKTTGSAFTI